MEEGFLRRLPLGIRLQHMDAREVQPMGRLPKLSCSTADEAALIGTSSEHGRRTGAHRQRHVHGRPLLQLRSDYDGARPTTLTTTTRDDQTISDSRGQLGIAISLTLSIWASVATRPFGADGGIQLLRLRSSLPERRDVVRHLDGLAGSHVETVHLSTWHAPRDAARRTSDSASG